MADTDPSKSNPDLTSLMSQVAALSSVNRKLEENNRSLEDKLKDHEVIVGRFKEQEREEMRKKLDTYIKQWVDENDWTDPKLKESVLNGMKEMVDQNKKDNTIWNMVCCASATHKKNVDEMQKLQQEYNSLRAKVEGTSVRSEDARVAGKRKEPEPTYAAVGVAASCGGSAAAGSSSSSGGSRSIWDEFGDNIRATDLSTFVPNPDYLRSMMAGGDAL